MDNQKLPTAATAIGARHARLAARLLQAPIALVWRRGPEGLVPIGDYGLAADERRYQGPVERLRQRLAADGSPAAAAGTFGGEGPFSSLAMARQTCADATVICCVADWGPRGWLADELAAIDDLATACAAELALDDASRARAQSQRFEAARRQSFEALLADRPLDEVLELLARGIEGQLAGGLCTIMLLDEAGLHLSTAAAPSISPEYAALIEGTAIGPMVGSCGTAAYYNTTVIVEDISSDPRWERWRDVAAAFGLRACWSTPVRAAEGHVLGTFALYYGEPRTPNAEELALVEGAAHVMALAVERSRNLAALRASEARLRRSEANITALFNHAKEAIWSLDREGRVITFNRQAERYFLNERKQRLWSDLVFPRMLDGEQLRIWEGLFEQALRGETATAESSRNNRMYELTLTPLTAGGAIVGAAAFLGDITERRQAETARLETERAWQETQRLESLGVLAAGIAHDFNNLLAVVLGHTELVLEELGADSNLADSLQQIASAARRGSVLTHQILAYAGQSRMRGEPLDINELILELAELVARTLPSAAPVSYELAANLPLVLGDPVQLQQLLMNLLTNAVEAIGEGEGAISLSTEQIELSEADGDLRAGHYVRLMVADTGPGIDEESLRRIFEPFFTSRFLGRGLGLAVAQGIVRGHGGAIQAHSALGKGTTVRILLPVS
jgi:PAS domain S-box-containing protein